MILVTGGTGLVGSNLLFSLTQQHAKVRATYRSKNSIDSAKNLFKLYGDTTFTQFQKIDWVEAPLNDISLLTIAFNGVSKVFHCAAKISFNPKDYSTLKKTNIEGTANIVNLCLSHNITKLIYLSSIATLGKTQNGELITEETHWNPEAKNNVYAISKYGGEMEVWRGTQEGLKACVLQPGVILGSGFWNNGSSAIVKKIDKGIPFFTTGGVGFVDVHDVVTAAIAAMESTITNRRFILVGQNEYFKTLQIEIAKQLGKKNINKKNISKKILLGLALLDKVISFLFRKKRSLFTSQVNSLYRTSFYDGSMSSKTLNFTYTPFNNTLERITSHYKQQKASL